MTNDFDPSHAFYVGQEVVCVKADYDPSQKTTIKPELEVGKVYKIRWLGVYSHYLDGDYLGIRVDGMDRGICPFWGYDDVPFRASRFRPLVKDPLAIFKRIATDPDYTIDAPEGPVRGEPDDGGSVKEKELEEV